MNVVFKNRMSEARLHQLTISKIVSHITTQNYWKPNILDRILTDGYKLTKNWMCVSKSYKQQTVWKTTHLGFLITTKTGLTI